MTGIIYANQESQFDNWNPYQDTPSERCKHCKLFNRCSSFDGGKYWKSYESPCIAYIKRDEE